jgi:hypothetical protein
MRTWVRSMKVAENVGILTETAKAKSKRQPGQKARAKAKTKSS